MKRKRLSRRTILRGVGLGGASIAVGLPVLECMLDDNGRLAKKAIAQSADDLPNMVAVCFPNAFPLSQLVPTATGTDYETTYLLEPIAHLKQHFNLGTNLYSLRGGNDLHGTATSGFLSGLPCSYLGSTGISIDQLAANRHGGGYAFPSLRVGVLENEAGYAPENVAEAAVRHISWLGSEQPAESYRNPGQLYDELFGAGIPETPEEQLRRADHRRNVLDFVRDDITRLNSRLGYDDRQRLDRHLTGINTLWNRVQSAVGCAAPGRPNDGGGHFARGTVLIDLMVTALACGLTRYATLIWDNGGSNTGSDSSLGLTDPHNVAHYGPFDMHLAFARAYFERFAQLLDAMNSIDEGDGTLLSNSLVYMSTEMADGGHGADGHPVIFAGNAKGRVTTGRHIRYPNNAKPSVARALLTVLEACGIDEPNFNGIQGGPLNEFLS